MGTPSTAVLTVADNGVAGAIQWSAAAYSATQGAGGVMVTITRSGGTASDASVRYATGGGTATAGVDYVATTGVVTFAAGETAKAIWIPFLVAMAPEGPETITVTLSDPTGGATVGTPSSALVFIVDR
jgi:hypothetical protein